MHRITASIAQIAAEAGAAPPRAAWGAPLDLPPELVAALERCHEAFPELPAGPETIDYILRDWLTGMGYLRHREDPEGAN